jgi:hypothetical protein
MQRPPSNMPGTPSSELLRRLINLTGNCESDFLYDHKLLYLAEMHPLERLGLVKRRLVIRVYKSPNIHPQC